MEHVVVAKTESTTCRDGDDQASQARMRREKQAYYVPGRTNVQAASEFLEMSELNFRC